MTNKQINPERISAAGTDMISVDEFNAEEEEKAEEEGGGGGSYGD